MTWKDFENLIEFQFKMTYKHLGWAIFHFSLNILALTLVEMLELVWTG